MDHPELEFCAEADDKSAMTSEQRAKADAETMNDLLDIERQEAALTWAAQSQSLPVEHRADISPQALFGVRMVSTPPRSRDVATGHSYETVQPWNR